MAKEVAYLTPEVTELFLRKLVTDKLAETTDEVGAMLGGGHQMVVRLRKNGGTYAEALAMAAILKGLKPFSLDSISAEGLAEVPNTPTGHALVKQPPKPKESRAEMRARLEVELRAQIEAEIRAKYKLPAEVPETVAA